MVRNHTLARGRFLEPEGLEFLILDVRHGVVEGSGSNCLFNYVKARLAI